MDGSLNRVLARYLPSGVKRVLKAVYSVGQSRASAAKPDSSGAVISAPAQPIPAVNAGPMMSHPEQVIGMSAVRSVHPTARLVVRERIGRGLGKISFAADVYLGTEVELAALDEISIGRDTSIQNYSTIHGDVSIGAFCLFGPFLMISSTTHRFRDIPYWHIRDQDDLISERPELAVQPVSDQIVVEDDCWIGSTVAMLPGVYIGRGAIVGANTVVTSDVGPFEIHGGVPNRKIGNRLEFVPPENLSAMEDADLPYFYRGLRTRQGELRESRRLGMIEADSCACVVLAGHPSPSVTISLARLARENPVHVRIRLNGVDRGVYEIADDRTEIVVNAAARSADSVVPKSLARWTYLLIERVTTDGQPVVKQERGFGIRYVTLNLPPGI